MRTVVFLIPGSPVRAFFAQIAAFRLAVSRLTWTRWRAQLHVCMGGEVDGAALAEWRSHLHDVPIVLVPPAVTEANPSYYGQIDELYRSAPDADVYARMDADTLPVGDLEDLLDHVVDSNVIAGVMAHLPFPPFPGVNPRDCWLRVADGLIDRPLDFRQAYSLAEPSSPEASRVAPFYLNDGAVFFPRALFAEYSRHYLRLRPQLMDRLAVPYFAGQVALTLAVTQMGARTSALPMRYNFPNDERATARFPEELQDARIFHYLRTDEFDRALIFDGAANYAAFLAAPLRRPSNVAFRAQVARLLGTKYPFGSAGASSAAIPSPVASAMSKEVYANAWAAHNREIAPQLAKIVAELAPERLEQLEPSRRRALGAQRVILRSGLFDPAFYLERNPDVREAGVDPLWHYVVWGEGEGRQPNPFFDAAYYRRRQKDLPKLRSALVHYVQEGERNGNRPGPGFDPAAYLKAHPELKLFVDRPLFHFLKIGHAAGLSPQSTPPEAAPALELLAEFESSGRKSLERLMKAKQALVQAFGVERGFQIFCESADLPDCDRLRVATLRGQRDLAREAGVAYVERSPGGKPFKVRPPALIGEGKLRAIEHVSRALYVACFADARVRGRSALVEVGSAAALDYEDWEFALFDCELDIDPSIFHAQDKQLWVMERADGGADLELDEAFMLLGPQSGAFGDWMYQYLPRYIAADMSGAMPAVPVLVDAGLHRAIRDSLQLMLRPGATVIPVEPYKTVRVKRLWCGSNLHYAPAREKMDARYKFDYNSYDPATFAPMLREMARRAAAAMPDQPGAERVFLARKPALWRKLVNHKAIEEMARARGFRVAYPEDLTFAEQISLVCGARFLIGPEGSAFALTYFCRPGSKVCVLCHPMIEAAASFTDVLEDVDISVFTGPVVRQDPTFPHRADYQIDEKELADFMDRWIAGDDLPRQISA